MSSLKTWWEQAKAHGTIYYVADKIARDGMGRHYYSLYTIGANGDRPGLFRAWPGDETGSYDAKLAKQLGFSLTHRTWMRSGCGYDRPHDVAYSIACFFDGHGATAKTMPRVEGLNSYEARR